MQGPLPAEHPAASASAHERLAALVAAFSLIAVGLAAMRVRFVPVGEVPGLLPCITAAGLLALLVSCALLRNQYRASGFAPFAFLAVAYGVCAGLIVAYLLTIPGIFSPTGFGLGPQVATWLWVGWHSAFIFLVGVYVAADVYFSRRTTDRLRAGKIVSLSSLSLGALAALSVRQSRRAQTALAILVLDLDHFKSYNDHFGHIAGDEALRAVAKTIGSIANRSTDVCCRVGGEEFAVVLRMTDEASAMSVAERIRSSVMRLHISHAPSVPLPSVTVSIGVAAIDGKGSVSPKALYGLADNALYRAKRLGRNRVAVAPLSIDPASLRAI